MKQHKQALHDTFDKIHKLALQPDTTVDFFLAGQSPKILGAADNINLDEVVFYGHSGHLQHLQQWRDMTKTGSYTAVFVLTDDGSYENETHPNITLQPTQPIWLVHVDGSLPYAYDDQLLELLNKSDGGVSTSIENAVQRQRWRLSHYANKTSTMTNNYFWNFERIDDINTMPTIQGLGQLAAHQWINIGHRIYHQGDMGTLDKLHVVATQYSIVSPFSSMIVVVNSQQKQDLETFSHADDRFNRSVETGAKSISAPIDAFTVQGVPEPEEWALIVVVLIMLAFAYIRNQKAIPLSPN